MDRTKRLTLLRIREQGNNMTPWKYIWMRDRIFIHWYNSNGLDNKVIIGSGAADKKGVVISGISQQIEILAHITSQTWHAPMQSTL